MVLSGVLPVLTMPFDGGRSLDLDGLRREVDFVAASGAKVIGFGFGSELDRLSEAEVYAALRVAVSHAGDDLVVMGTARGDSVEAVAASADRNAESGARLLMVRPPTGLTDPELLIRCCNRIGNATGLGIVFQDAPDFTRTLLSAEALVRVATESEHVVALKIESGNAAERIRIASQFLTEGVAVLGGGAGLDFMNELGSGASGCVPFAGLTPEFISIHSSWSSGETTPARTLHAQLLPFLILGLRGFDAALYIHKELLRRRGIVENSILRAPEIHPDKALFQDLDRLLGDFPVEGLL